MNTFFHRLSLAGLFLCNPVRLFEHIESDPWYSGDRLEWIDGLALAQGARVVELGCGPGGLALKLARRGHAVTAVDRSRRMIARLERATRRGGVAVDGRVADASQTGLPGGAFDTVVGASILNVVNNPDDLVAEALRLLRPGGVLSFYMPNPSLNRANIERFVGDRGLRPASAAIFLTWGAKADKVDVPTAESYLLRGGAQAVHSKFHLGGMVSSVSGLRAADPHS